LQNLPCRRATTLQKFRILRSWPSDSRWFPDGTDFALGKGMNPNASGHTAIAGDVIFDISWMAGSACHELRIVDGGANWRIVYHLATDAVVVLDVFAKKTATTPKSVIDNCRKRLAMFKQHTAARKRGRHARR